MEDAGADVTEAAAAVDQRVVIDPGNQCFICREPLPPVERKYPKACGCPPGSVAALFHPDCMHDYLKHPDSPAKCVVCQRRYSSYYKPGCVYYGRRFLKVYCSFMVLCAIGTFFLDLSDANRMVSERLNKVDAYQHMANCTRIDEDMRARVPVEPSRYRICTNDYHSADWVRLSAVDESLLKLKVYQFDLGTSWYHRGRHHNWDYALVHTCHWIDSKEFALKQYQAELWSPWSFVTKFGNPVPSLPTCGTGHDGYYGSTIFVLDNRVSVEIRNLVSATITSALEWDDTTIKTHIETHGMPRVTDGLIALGVVVLMLGTFFSCLCM